MSDVVTVDCAAAGRGAKARASAIKTPADLIRNMENPPEDDRARLTPGHQAFDPGDSGEIVIDDRHHEHQDEHETGQQHLLLQPYAEVPARHTLEGHDEDVPAVEHRNRKQ